MRTTPAWYIFYTGCMTRDYDQLLPRVLRAIYPDIVERREIIDKLAAYGKQSFHAEPARVHPGILKLAWAQPEKLDEYITLACKDCRDLLCAAKYPLSSPDYRLKWQDPVRYKQFQEEVLAAYDVWLAQVL